ncbi:MAG: efflux RND transporter periplasmic adaptor subunit [Bryobacteraceae bacterium]
MTKALIWIVIVLIIAGGVWALVSARNAPPQISFARVAKETIASSVPTNGRVEPIEWGEAKADRSGPIEKIFVQRGQNVNVGDPLVEIGSQEARADLAAAQARVSQAKADLEILDKGGRVSDIAALDGEIERAKFEVSAAQKDYDALTRLQTKQAVTSYEVAQAKERLDRIQVQIRTLEQRRGTFVSPPDKTSAQARLKDAEMAVSFAEERIRKSTFRAPVAGTVYQFELKPGGYLNAGDLVAGIGQVNRVRVKVFVDEPDLGRVTHGMPVVITWDAQPGKQWQGVVDRTPTQIVPLGTRQVGEVLCIIENPGKELLPGTNVNAEILSEKVDSALVIPKEAIRRENGQTGVLTLSGNALAWKQIKLGIANTTKTQVEGLNDGEPVALPNEKTLKAGMVVEPVYP